jgi:hypothetical protein
VLRGAECRCFADAAEVLWGLVGRLCGSAEVLGGFWVGAEECGRWEAVQVLSACCLLSDL